MAKRSARSITNQSCSQLETSIAVVTRKLKTYGWQCMGLAIVGAGAIYGCLELYPEYLWYTGAAAASALAINAYLALEHYYNYLRYCNTLRATIHGLNVTRSMTAARLELSTAFRVSDMWDWTLGDVHAFTHDRLAARKRIWMIKSVPNPAAGETYTVVYNGFYEHLYFLFAFDMSAHEFMVKLKEKTVEQVTELAQSPDLASRIQGKFLEARSLTLVFDSYYKTFAQTRRTN